MAFSRSKDNKYISIGALLIASTFLCGSLVGAVAPARTAFATDAATLLNEAAEAGRRAAEGQKQVEALRVEIEGLDKQATEYLNQAAALQPEIEVASERTEQLTLDLRNLEEDADRLRSKIAATAAEYAKQQELVGGRMSEAYKQGDFFFFDLLLSARSFKDLITRFEYVQRTIESNALFARDLDLTRRELENDKAQLDVVVAEAAIKQKEAADAEGNLRNLKASREEAAHNAEQVQSQKAVLMADTQASVDANRAMEAQLYAEANAMLGKLKNQVSDGTGNISGSMLFPVGGGYNMSCGFGCGCSIHGGNHKGQDFGTYNSNPPAVAVLPGRVVFAGWNGGYGNFVSIDHGEGVVTQYAHLASIAVSAGQMVGSGTILGNIGSTGFSFGNHLHFEVIVNGSHRNPMSYL